MRYTARNTNRSSTAWLILVFGLGAIGFSQISFKLIVQILGAPLYLPEPFIFALLLSLYWQSPPYLRPRLTVRLWVFGIGYAIVLTGMVFLGLLEGSIREVLSSGRPWAFIFAAAIFAPCLRSVRTPYVLAFLIGVLVGEGANALLAPILDVDYRGISPVNLIGVSLAVSFSILYGRPVLIWMVLSCAVVLVFLSGFRAVIAVGVIGFLGTLFLKVARARFLSGVRQVFQLTLMLIVSGFLAFWVVKEYVGIDPYAYYRVVNRTAAYLEGGIDAAQDDGRFYKMGRYIQEPGEIWPQGFIMVAEDLVGNFNDVPFLNFTYTFGVPVGVALILGLLALGGRHLYLTARHGGCDVDYGAAVGFGVFVFLLIFNGRFLYISYETVLFGFIVGLWVTKRGPLQKNVCSERSPSAPQDAQELDFGLAGLGGTIKVTKD